MKKNRNFTALIIGMLLAICALSAMCSCGSKDSHVKDLYFQIDSLNAEIVYKDSLIINSVNTLLEKEEIIEAALKCIESGQAVIDQQKRTIHTLENLVTSYRGY